MKLLKIVCLSVVLTAAFGSVQVQAGEEEAAAAGDDPLAYVMEGCGAEVENYCSQVTLGEGRLAACFFAHEDKLSNRCQHTLYDMALALEAAMNTLVYLATECEGDIDNLCADVEPGDGAILNCLTAQSDSLSESCSTALSDVEG